ncbi:hypothetical protein [Thioclava sp. JE_KL1]|uniref:hypothetical protein n=1 Tax=Thioclava sp. JE_KL1 TaxID=2651187 RepID=UPI00128CB24D|nr:hypothetical protein [Thioclava sp. JE_KL1]MPQ92915.1 hypothetical protein [Thioclava sp. JE_KL1]
MRGASILLCAALALAGCSPFGPTDEGDTAEQLPLVGQEKIDAGKFECVARGGKWLARDGAFICVTMTSDSGKSCQAGSECEGECLARSKTCAPVTPLLGCNEVMSEAGYPMQLCVQ